MQNVIFSILAVLLFFATIIGISTNKWQVGGKLGGSYSGLFNDCMSGTDKKQCIPKPVAGSALKLVRLLSVLGLVLAAGGFYASRLGWGNNLADVTVASGVGMLMFACVLYASAVKQKGAKLGVSWYVTLFSSIFLIALMFVLRSMRVNV